jgi:acyl dehydratase
METLTLDKLENLVGTEIGVSAWRVVSQEMIDKFADATDDHQFIHIDPERARKETTFGGTIAHGFLTLSLLATLAYEVLPPVEGATMGINYGFDKIRFAQPVKSGSRIRARFTLAKIKIRPSGFIESAYDVTMEIENSIKPAFVARWLTIAVLNNQHEAV